MPRVVRLDNLKAGVTRACLYDPDVNAVYAAFATHWGFTPLSIQPRTPRHNGKQERSGGYVKGNARRVPGATGRDRAAEAGPIATRRK